MILKTFDPKKADAIFAEEGETPSWLAELIEYPTWRSLIYRWDLSKYLSASIARTVSTHNMGSAMLFLTYILSRIFIPWSLGCSAMIFPIILTNYIPIVFSFKKLAFGTI